MTETPQPKKDVSEIRASLARIEGMLSDAPTKDWVTTRLFWVIGALVAATGLIEFLGRLIAN